LWESTKANQAVHPTLADRLADLQRRSAETDRQAAAAFAQLQHDGHALAAALAALADAAA
jgi:hypothetical protein